MEDFKTRKPENDPLIYNGKYLTQLTYTNLSSKNLTEVGTTLSKGDSDD